MMKYYLITAAMILAAPVAMAQSDATTASGDESHHVESYDSTSSTPVGTTSSHDAVESHSTTATDGSGAVTSTTTDETHSSHNDNTND